MTVLMAVMDVKWWPMHFRFDDFLSYNRKKDKDQRQIIDMKGFNSSTLAADIMDW